MKRPRRCFCPLRQWPSCAAASVGLASYRTVGSLQDHRIRQARGFTSFDALHDRLDIEALFWDYMYAALPKEEPQPTMQIANLERMVNRHDVLQVTLSR